MTDDEADGTDSAEIASGAVYSCDNCGSLLDLSTWTPTETDENSAVCRFCDDECRSEWVDD